MSVPGFISVEEAASRLGVIPRRVRAMIAAGLLDAQKVGSDVWLVDAASVEERRVLHPDRGRPLASENAWGAVWMASGMRPHWLSSVQRSRLKRRLEDSGLESMARMLRKRSDVHPLRAAEDDLPEIAEHPLVMSGVSAAAEYGLEIRAPGVIEAYVRQHDLTRLLHMFGLQTSRRPNLILRVPRGIWPFADDERFAPIGVVAADLLDSTDERTRRAGHLAAQTLMPS